MLLGMTLLKVLKANMGGQGQARALLLPQALLLASYAAKAEQWYDQ